MASLEFRTALEPIRNRFRGADYLQGWADAVDFTRKTVTIEDAVRDPYQGLALTAPRDEGKTQTESYAESVLKARRGQLFDIHYDKLIISVGSYSQTFNIPGVRENANFLKDVGDARKIRKRILECFETASLPTTPEETRKQLLNFAIVGGGPTGIEFAAELFDLIRDDLIKLYPDLADLPKVTIYDVAPRMLAGFDDQLAEYAMAMFRREGINVRTSTAIESLYPGLPGNKHNYIDGGPGFTLKVKDEEEVGVGMTVWSTGLMANPFIRKALSAARDFPPSEVIFKSDFDAAEKTQWSISTHGKTGSVVTNDRLRVILEADANNGEPMRAFLKDAYAIGDCAMIDGTQNPATAQVAAQKAEWLATRLNKGDLQTSRFQWKNQGAITYLGNFKAIVQSGGDMKNMQGKSAWAAWRGLHLYKTVSWRNRILIPIYL